MKLVPNVIMILAAFLLSTSCSSADEPSTQTGFTLSATIAPDPPIVGQNTLTLTVEDLDGARVEGATIVVDPQMPAHGHGSNEVAVVEELGDGTYEAFPLTFTMPGSWEVTVTATHPKFDGVEGEQVFDYSVQ